ncbi:hypothetical protein EON65_28220 [archaeon]|nr:MAG: hypothetical protein EON65_28220 [archaeon]
MTHLHSLLSLLYLPRAVKIPPCSQLEGGAFTYTHTHINTLTPTQSLIYTHTSSSAVTLDLCGGRNISYSPPPYQSSTTCTHTP